jgi:alkylation response protein AidB-like acyl-CoA dehydrogenase
MSEMLIELELARGMVYRGLAAIDAPSEERERALSAMKVQVGRSGKFVCGQAIQLHGGIGVTEEYVIGHHFKRMTTIEYALGSSHMHLERLAAYARLQAA